MPDDVDFASDVHNRLTDETISTTRAQRRTGDWTVAITTGSRTSYFVVENSSPSGVFSELDDRGVDPKTDPHAFGCWLKDGTWVLDIRGNNEALKEKMRKHLEHDKPT